METNDARWTDEEQVFAGLVEDVLRVATGLSYRRFITGDGALDEDGTYATFVIETNPAHDLSVAIELARDELRFIVNDAVYAHAVEGRRRIDRWMERRCRDVERLVDGDLLIEDDLLLSTTISSELQAGRDGTWHEIGARDDGWGWIALAGWILPFGLSLTRTTKTTYERWYARD